MKVTSLISRLAFCLSLSGPAALLAQVQSGRIVGNVTDPNKSVVPNASVTVTNKATNQTLSVRTNGAGDYGLTPGAALLPGGGNLLRIRANYWSGESISGVRGRQTTFLLDGVDVTDHHQGGTMIQTSIDALQEFKVQQSEYSAEVSHAGGVL